MHAYDVLRLARDSVLLEGGIWRLFEHACWAENKTDLVWIAIFRVKQIPTVFGPEKVVDGEIGLWHKTGSSLAAGENKSFMSTRVTSCSYFFLFISFITNLS